MSVVFRAPALHGQGRIPSKHTMNQRLIIFRYSCAVREERYCRRYYVIDSDIFCPNLRFEFGETDFNFTVRVHVCHIAEIIYACKIYDYLQKLFLVQGLNILILL